MALFPAYSKQNINNEQQDKDTSKKLQWVDNESCPSEVVILENPSLIRNDQFNLAAKTSNTDGGINQQDEKISQLDIGIKNEFNLIDNFRNKQQKRVKLKKRSISDSKFKTKSRVKYNISSGSDTSRYPNSQKWQESSQIFTKNNAKNVFFDGLLSSSKPEDFIYLDYYGDNNNKLFGATHYTQLAKYNKQKSYLGNVKLNQNNKRKFAKRYFHKLRFYSSETILASKTAIDSYSNTDNADIFIPLNHTKHAIGCRSSNPLNILDLSTENYILGKGKINEKDQEMQEIKFPEWQIRIREFNEKINKEPNNISLWLQYVHFQDKVVDYWIGRERKSSRISLTQITEKKLAILETAIKKNENCSSLYLERLRIGQDIWEHDQLLKEWDNLINTFSFDAEIWHQLLIFHQTYFPSFHLLKVVNVHIRFAQKLMNSLLIDPFTLKDDSQKNSHFLIDGITQLAYIWKQGGFMERSIALFQALFELSFHCPSHLKSADVSSEIVIDVFEAFWDSKAPRFGEKNSVGWTKYIDKKESVTFPDVILEGTQDEEDLILSKVSDKNKIWLELELSRELNQWLPFQQDPDMCEDPDRLVSFSDIRPHLFLINTEKDCFYLALQFLSFLGVSIHSSAFEECSSVEHHSSLFRLRIETLQDFLLNEPGTRGKDEDDDIFYFSIIGPSIRKLSAENFFQFVCNVIYLLINWFSIKYKIHLGVILIRLYSERCFVVKKYIPESYLEAVKTFKKQIKKLLKRPEFYNNLEIYYEYAIFEKNLGLFEEALKIHAMSLALGLQSTTLFSLDCIANNFVIWKHLLSIIKIEIKNKQCMNSVQNLICSASLGNKFSNEKTPPSAMHILKAKKKLNYFKDEALKKMSLQIFTPIPISCCITCLSVLQFLTVGYKPACLVFEDFLSQLNKVVFEDVLNLSRLQKLKELVYENYIWFIHITPKLKHICSTLPMSPISLRNILNTAVKIAPYNLYLLNKLSHCQFQMWREIHSKIKNLDNDEDPSILVTIFQLVPHIRTAIKVMSEPDCGVLSYQLLNILETAVNTVTGRHCPLLWRLYLRIAHYINPQAVKTLAYMAMNNCPFAKCIYLDCIRLLPEITSEILVIMSEKGIRIRLPMEELKVLQESEVENPDKNRQMDLKLEECSEC